MSQARLDAAREVLREAEVRAATFNGPCSACKWSQLSVLEAGRVCRNPVVLAQMLTIDDATARTFAGMCHEQRDSASHYAKPTLCGPEGTLFEPSLTERLKRLVRGEDAERLPAVD